MFPTTGILHVRLADADPILVCVGCTVTYHRTLIESEADAPYGVETITINSDAGYIFYEQVDTEHHFTWMAEVPVDG